MNGAALVNALHRLTGLPIVICDQYVGGSVVSTEARQRLEAAARKLRAARTGGPRIVAK